MTLTSEFRKASLLFLQCLFFNAVLFLQCSMHYDSMDMPAVSVETITLVLPLLFYMKGYVMTYMIGLIGVRYALECLGEHM